MYVCMYVLPYQILSFKRFRSNRLGVKKCDDMSTRFDTVPTLVGLTDRRTELIKQYRALHA